MVNLKAENRRRELLEMLRREQQPLSGTRLSKLLGVSRQAIVQDIALLRQKNPEIISTVRGYVLHGLREEHEAIFWVTHSDEAIEDELNVFIDLGGRVHNVIVEHEVYGRISAELPLASRRDIQAFLRRLGNSGVRPLKELTGGNHGHLVSANDEAALREIARELEKKGYLIRREPGFGMECG
jgi:transcriptional regulator of NAD metabolism